MGTDGDAYLADLAEDSPGNEGAEARFKVSRAREALASKAIGGIGPRSGCSWRPRIARSGRRSCGTGPSRLAMV